MVIAETKSVLKFNPFTDQKQGIMGSLFCTNFRLSYVTADGVLSSADDGRQRNRLISEHDIPLMSIDAVYESKSFYKAGAIYHWAPVQG
jgi:hypothetical protein